LARPARRFSGNKKISSADSIFRDKPSLFAEQKFAHGDLVLVQSGRSFSNISEDE
jgi:hypothetical protein